MDRLPLTGLVGWIEPVGATKNVPRQETGYPELLYISA